MGAHRLVDASHLVLVRRRARVQLREHHDNLAKDDREEERTDEHHDGRDAVLENGALERPRLSEQHRERHIHQARVVAVLWIEREA